MSSRFLNLDNRDYHMHSSNFSDGLCTIDEIVRLAGETEMKSIVITDHSQFCIDYCNTKYKSTMGGSFRRSLPKWKNVINDVEVTFGVEGDLMNESGEVCFDIQGVEPEFRILSAHSNVYQGANESVTDATIKAMERYKGKIAFIAHPCNVSDFGQHYDIERLVSSANEHNIPLEFNAKNFVQGRTNMDKLDYLLKNAHQIYVNSDGHTLYEIKETRKQAIQFLREKGYV